MRIWLNYLMYAFLFGSCSMLLLLWAGCMQKPGAVSHEQLEFPAQIPWPEYEIQSFGLENGVEVFLAPSTELPLIKMQLQARYGSFQVPQGLQGLDQVMAEVMLSGGSQKYPEQELNRILENKAAQLDIQVQTQVLQVELNVLQEDFQELLPVVVDILKNPNFPKHRIQLAQGQLKSSIARRNDKQSEIAFRKFKELIYGPESIYARTPGFESVDRISRQDLLDLHAAIFQGSNLQVGLVGDFEPREIRTVLEKELKRFKEGQGTELDFPEVDYTYQASLNLVHKPDLNQSFILMGHIGGYRQDPDYAALQVLNEVLSKGFSGRLFRRIRSEQGLAYSVFGRFDCHYFFPGLFFVGLQTQSARTAEAIQAVQAELLDLQQNGVLESELGQAKDSFLNSLVFRFDNPKKVLQRRMYYAYRDMDQDSFSKLIEEIKQVSAGDVHRVAQKYLHPGQLQVLVVGNRPQVLPGLQKLGQVRELELD